MAELAYREVYAMNRSGARKKLVRTDLETGSVSATARYWHTSRQVVRKWVARYREQGDAGLADLSRRPRRSPRQTASDVEQAVWAARQQTHLGRQRLPRYQWAACDGRTRLRFLAYSHALSTTRGLTFLLLVPDCAQTTGVYRT